MKNWTSIRREMEVKRENENFVNSSQKDTWRIFISLFSISIFTRKYFHSWIYSEICYFLLCTMISLERHRKTMRFLPLLKLKRRDFSSRIQEFLQTTTSKKFYGNISLIIWKFDEKCKEKGKIQNSSSSSSQKKICCRIFQHYHHHHFIQKI